VTPRGTDWSLALLVALGLVTGVATWFAGSPDGAWVFGAHAVAGTALALVLAWKLRRVWARVADRARWDGRTGPALAAVTLVGATLGSGLAWSSGGRLDLAGYNLLNWHVLVGGLLGAVVLGHALLRAKPLRARDLRSRRQFLTAAAVGAGALALWQVQRPLQRALGLPGSRRRFTGSYDAGEDFPATSWVADAPRPLDPVEYRLTVAGHVHAPLALSAGDLDADDELTATLDCTGGFYATRRWRGTSLGRVLDRAGVAPEARHVRVVSHTGFRWSFSLEDARALLLATRVGDIALSHGHGAPCRLVAPGRRGFQWVKWVTRVEVHEDPDPGALASTVWSSFTRAGRGKDGRG
jgi:DMSO/TMAO reductase YedYZ molybdopterin-dependent catalytic subunit